MLRHAKAPGGEPLVTGRKVTGLTNSEEESVQLTQVVPFLVEDMLKANGGLYGKDSDLAPFVLTEGQLVTRQNPASAEPAAKALLQLPG